LTRAADKSETASEDIDPEERLHLWVRAGARCAMCNDSLLEHEYTALNVHKGEMAHIVGRTKSSRSPRGQADLPVTDRNLADNLVLLCPTDHTAIDKKLGQKEWTVENLQELKRRHEDRVRYLTGLGEDAETVVIRAIGGIRSGDVSVEPEAVRKAVFARQRYPRYELGARSGSDIEVDFRRLPAEGAETYWETARQMLSGTGMKLADGIQRGHVRHVSVFFRLHAHPAARAARRPARRQVPDRPLRASPRRPRMEVGRGRAARLLPLRARRRRGRRPGRHARVLDQRLGAAQPAPGGDRRRRRLRTATGGRRPLTDLIRVPETLAAFSATYRAFLASIEGEHPNATVLHVLGALPLTAAIELGRRRTSDVHPPLHVWDRNRDGECTFAVDVGS